MKLAIVATFAFLTSIAAAADWSEIKWNVGGNNATLKDTDKEVILVWNSPIVPGGELLLIKSIYTRYQETFFQRYEFAGVIGNALQINVRGGSQSKGESSARDSKSMEKTVYVERADDGAFYFVPESIVGEGGLRISRNLQSPGLYMVTLQQRLK